MTQRISYSVLKFYLGGLYFKRPTRWQVQSKNFSIESISLITIAKLMPYSRDIVASDVVSLCLPLRLLVWASMKQMQLSHGLFLSFVKKRHKFSFYAFL